MPNDEKKRKGAFYTSADVASYLVSRAIRDVDQKILEPSFGDGSFIQAILQRYQRWNAVKKAKDNLYAVEIREDAVAECAKNPLIDPLKIVLADFISVDPFPVDVVIGNPPYVGLNRLAAPERKRAQHLIDMYGFNMQASGSLWLPFVLHSCAFLKRGGRLAFVLPFEMTYVRYGKQLWKFLGEHFAELTVIRIFEDVFPDVDVETVLFVAGGYGDKTNFINYEIYPDKSSLFRNKPEKRHCLAIESTLNADRPFVANLLDQEHLNMVRRLRWKGLLKPLGGFCKFKIGYVCADSQFFHPTPEVISKFGLSEDELLPAIANAKAITRATGLFIRKNAVTTRLFYPRDGKTRVGTQKYIQYGQTLGVNERFKCRQRSPWYVTPGIEVPDIILTVFGDKPRLYVNSGQHLASNSLLCGFLKQPQIRPVQIAASWYNSLTLLSVELKVHSLGGGVLVFIPGETDPVEVIDPSSLTDIDRTFYAQLDGLLGDGCVEEAYALGDSYVLTKVGLSAREIAQVRDGVQTLRKWRNARLRKTLRTG